VFEMKHSVLAGVVLAVSPTAGSVLDYVLLSWFTNAGLQPSHNLPVWIAD
jgi:hypothetical protein